MERPKSIGRRLQDCRDRIIRLEAALRECRKHCIDATILQLIDEALS